MKKAILIFLVFPAFFAHGQKNNLIMLEEFIFTVAPFKQCHASSIVFTGEGLVAVWFGGTHEKNEDVEIWLSRQQNGKWTAPKSVANGIQHDRKRYPCWNPVLFKYPNGPLFLFYKVGPNPQQWWGMYKKSEDYGQTWSEGCRLPEDILGPVKNKPVLLEDGRLLCPSSTEHEGWRIHFEETSDMGKSWKLIGPLENAGDSQVIQPSILNYGNNKLQILCRSQNNRIMSSWSTDGGKSWSKIEPTGLPNPNSGTDAVTLSNGLQILVYNHTQKDEGKWGGARTPLNVAVSKDGSAWEMIHTLEDQPGEYSYPAVIQSPDGMVHISYTWKRERIKHVVLDPSKIKL